MPKRKKMKPEKMTAAQIATAEMMSYPDWKIRLAIAKKEAKEGKGISLELYLKKRKETSRRKAA